MSAYQFLLDEFEQLLTSRGYSESAINSADKPGTLFKTFKQNISAALRESLYDDQPFYFDLRTTGFFHDNADMITFRLHFLFDVGKQSLSITGLDLSSDRVERKIILQTNHDLPHTNDSIKLLDERRKWFTHRFAEPIRMPIRKKKGRSR